MATSIRQFNVELYREHLEEASFLYEQRLAYLHDPEVELAGSPGLGRTVRGAHRRAGRGRRSRAGRLPAAAGRDAGEMHAALARVLPSEPKRRRLCGARRTRSDRRARRFAPRRRRSAARRPPAWRDDLLRVFQSDRSHLTPVLARVVGLSPLSVRRASQQQADREDRSSEAPSCAWALGRVGSAGSVPLLWPLLDSDDERSAKRRRSR